MLLSEYIMSLVLSCYCRLGLSDNRRCDTECSFGGNHVLGRRGGQGQPALHHHPCGQ